MKLEETKYDNSETNCCAKLAAEKWEGRELEWRDKPFLKDHYRAIFHVPLNLTSVMTRDHAAVQKAEAYPEEPLWLTDEVSPWGADTYLAVDREVPGAHIKKLSGKFVTKVFEGPYRDAEKWVRQMDQYLSGRGQTAKKLYFYYPTCPRCAKHYGKNQVVLFAQLQ